MQMRVAKLVCVLLVGFGLLNLTAINENKPLAVVATNTLIADWVNEVAQDKIKLKMLVGPNSDVHSFEPSPQDVQRLSQADLIFENGLGLEYWLNALYKASDSKALRVPLSEGLQLLPYEDCGHACHAHHMDNDPHVWLDVQNVILMVKKIEEALIQHDPLNEYCYHLNANNYIKKLQDLDKWILEQIQNIPADRRKLITNHNNFRYFAKRYGLTILGSVLQSGTTEDMGPSVRGFSQLVKLIRQYNVPAVFGENVQNPALIRQLAAQAHLPLPEILYTEALGPANGPAKNYIELMRYDVNTLVKGLGE